MKDIFATKRAEKLANRGFDLLEQGDYDEAIVVAAEVESLRYSAAFEIAAQAHVGLGETQKAIETLERGVSVAPDVWLNWQLLGNLRSDRGNVDGARQAYQSALACPGVWTASVRLNQAVLLNRQEKYQEALDLLGGVDDHNLRTAVAEAKMCALIELDRFREALEIGHAALAVADYETHGPEAVRVGVLLGQTRLDQGEPETEVRQNMLALVNHDPNNLEALALIRKTYARYSSTSKYWRILLHGQVPEVEEAKGYYVSYDAVSDSPDGALEFIEEFEAMDGHHGLRIEESEALEDRPSDPQGVYKRTGRNYYVDEDDEDEDDAGTV